MDPQRKVYASRLGYYMDGWADLIEGMGSKAEDVRADVMKQLVERGMPDVVVEAINMNEGILSDKHRNYVVTATFPGVTTTIYVSEHGSDLFASWRTFVRTTIDEELMSVYGVISFLLTIAGYIINNWSDIINLNVGKIFKGLLNPDNINNYTLLSLITYFLIILLIILFLAVIAGIIIKQNILAFILKEPSLFDKEDIAAMSLTVHKTLIRSLDTVGIDVSKLRLKGEFKNGRRGEKI